MAIKCQVSDKDDAKTKLSVYVCDKHYDKGKEKLIHLIRELRAEEDVEIIIGPPEKEPEQPQPTPTPPTPTPQPQPTPTPTPTPTTLGSDKWGIKKLYPDAEGDKKQVWYMWEDDAIKDPLLGNEERAGLKKQADGSWYLDGMQGTTKGQVRIEGRCTSRDRKWLNGEVTVYAQYLNDLPNSTTEPGAYAYQVYLRGANHSTSNPCIGSCYKVRIRKDGTVAIVKELQHPDYASNRSGTRKINQEIKGKWLGVKEVVYNFVENGKTFVKIELWVDENVTDAQGNLAIKNNWQKIAETVDRGGWGAMSQASTCPSVSVDSTTKDKRQPDEIISMSGGTPDWNCAAFRTDGTATKIKYYSVREIKAPK